MLTLNPTSDFFTKGYASYQLEDLSVLDIFDGAFFKSVEAHDGDADETWAAEKLKNNIQPFINFIFFKIVKPVFNQARILDFAIWNGVDSGSLAWHNDCHSIKSLNSNILIYIDNQIDPHQGQLFVRGNGFESTIAPNRGKIVWLNQIHAFQHKAARSNSLRRVVGIDLYISEIAQYNSFNKEEMHGNSVK